MEAHGPPTPTPGPPAEVYIFVLPPAGGPHGRYSLLCHPKRRGDTRVYFTPEELKEHATHGVSREIIWIPRGLSQGQALTISEKAGSPGKGVFADIPVLHSATPFQTSGAPRRGPRHGEDPVIWSYQIVLSDRRGVLAYLDPEVVVVSDP